MEEGEDLPQAWVPVCSLAALDLEGLPKGAGQMMAADPDWCSAWVEGGGVQGYAVEEEACSVPLVAAEAEAALAAALAPAEDLLLVLP